jgi:hypothetical protein
VLRFNYDALVIYFTNPNIFQDFQMILNFWVASNFNHNYWALAWYDVKCVIVSIVGRNYTISSATMKPMCLKSLWTIFHYVKIQLRNYRHYSLKLQPTLHQSLSNAYNKLLTYFWHKRYLNPLDREGSTLNFKSSPSVWYSLQSNSTWHLLSYN